jgi:hypothetical protein
MPINRRKSQLSAIHFLAKRVGVSPRCLADKTITPAGVNVGLKLASNTFVEGE